VRAHFKIEPITLDQVIIPRKILLTAPNQEIIGRRLKRKLYSPIMGLNFNCGYRRSFYNGRLSPVTIGVFKVVQGIS